MLSKKIDMLVCFCVERYFDFCLLLRVGFLFVSIVDVKLLLIRW